MRELEVQHFKRRMLCCCHNGVSCHFNRYHVVVKSNAQETKYGAVQQRRAYELKHVRCFYMRQAKHMKVRHCASKAGELMSRGKYQASESGKRAIVDFVLLCVQGNEV